ncbi:SusC/RagA family TonB-linked outer membrane protein [Parapedobacter koreensis]|uniref:TonB-linked outer membrane protein, SusC/RagA family n=1 Tax=Parapedobacter koreensis TaxID=332977 RepID=A0A1H7PVV9_9SPHI|nr:SusC/RagA family TonB-linked outer membrane protein [Parapedobacter koreensis]SEL39395.1 TonB-linked outer membrane protein, SusC/RagA family [Parapedobacter koreensis]
MRLFLILFVVLFITTAFAQQRKITGTVLSRSTGEALSGVTIKGTSQTTATDANGKFSINAASGETLVLSYVGMNDLRVTVTDETTELNLAMEENTATLDQVVIVGYTTQRKKDLTGSIAVVNLSSDVTSTTSGNTAQALQGRVAGLYIEKDGSPNGATSRILIRGSNTLGNNNPLYVIDGVPTTRPEVFQNLNPASIESVQILKDASASSIYGSRASNGVIIVTTKNGGNTEGKVQFQLNSNVAAQSERSIRFNVLNAIDRGRALWQASINDRQDPAAAYGEIYNFDWNGNYEQPVLNGVSLQPFVGGDSNTPSGDTDWQDVMYKTGMVTNNNLTASVGNKNSSLELGFGYIKNTGMMRYTGYDRISGNINAVTRAFNDKLTLGVNINIANSNELLTANDLGGSASTFNAVTLAPTIPVFQKDGSTYAGELGAGYSDRNNPLHMQYLARWNNTNRLNTFGNVFIEVQPVKNLFFRSSIGADDSRFLRKVIEPTFTEGALSRTTNSLTHDQNHFLSLTLSNTLRYNLALGDHSRFNFLLGTEYIKTDLNYQLTRKQGFSIQTEDYFTLNAATGNTSVSGNLTGNRLFSQFARVDYNLLDRYLIAVTIRRDGSSRFGSNNQYGVFPAASIGWKIDQEDFMRDSRLFSELKLRLGVGRVGNQEIGDIARYALYEARYGLSQNELTPGFWEPYMNIGTAYSLNGANTGMLPSGFVQTQGGNPNLKWESTGELNAGLDFALLENKIFGSFDYFSRKTTGILITPPVASALGEGQSKPVNGATKTNKGWEFVVGYRGEKSGDFSYDVQMNFAHFRDEITELPESVRPAYPGNLLHTIIGHSQFDIFGYKTDGLFQSQQEVDEAPTQIGAAPGRIRYVDLNGDDRIDDLDRTWIGTTLPKLEYGVRIGAAYRSFDISIFASGVAGRSGYDVYSNFNNLMKSRENVGPGVFNGWTPTNTDTNVPALTLVDANNETRTSDYFMVNTAYFKMRNIQLGYNLTPKSIFSNVRFFVMGENLFWIKSNEYQGPDPERIDLGPVPIPKTYTFGVNLSF